MKMAFNFHRAVITTHILLTPSFTILTRLDGEVLAQVTEGWPGAIAVTWTQVKIHASGILG